MKKLAFAAILSIAIAGVSFAQEVTTTSVEQAQPEKKEIKMDKVPAAVQESFKKSGLTADNVKSIHEVESADGKAYKFTVDSEGKKWTVNYDAKGNLLGKDEVKK